MNWFLPYSGNNIQRLESILYLRSPNKNSKESLSKKIKDFVCYKLLFHLYKDLTIHGTPNTVLMSFGLCFSFLFEFFFLLKTITRGHSNATA